MKFWKPVLLTTLLFSAFTALVTYTSCEKDPCTNISCNNGGSCNAGACKCPTGFEGATCDTKVTTRFVGTYVGITTCNMGAYIIDTVFITDNVARKPTTVKAIQKTHPYDTLYGTVSVNETTYAITFPDIVFSKFRKKITATLQSDKTLVFNTYVYDSTNINVIEETKCIFNGAKLNR